MNTIDVSNMDEARVLAALYNAAKPLGMGMLHYDPTPMTTDEARDLLTQQRRFDYLKGRPMTLNFDESPLRIDLYDRDQGDGLAARVIGSL